MHLFEDNFEVLATHLSKVIEPCTSLWGSLLVTAKKKDGRKRWVTDLIELNRQKIKDSYHLINIRKILQSSRGNSVFYGTPVEHFMQ